MQMLKYAFFALILFSAVTSSGRIASGQTTPPKKDSPAVDALKTLKKRLLAGETVRFETFYFDVHIQTMGAVSPDQLESLGKPKLAYTVKPDSPHIKELLKALDASRVKRDESADGDFRHAVILYDSKGARIASLYAAGMTKLYAGNAIIMLDGRLTDWICALATKNRRIDNRRSGSH